MCIGMFKFKIKIIKCVLVILVNLVVLSQHVLQTCTCDNERTHIMESKRRTPQNLDVSTRIHEFKSVRLY